MNQTFFLGFIMQMQLSDVAQISPCLQKFPDFAYGHTAGLHSWAASPSASPVSSPSFQIKNNSLQFWFSGHHLDHKESGGEIVREKLREGFKNSFPRTEATKVGWP